MKNYQAGETKHLTLKLYNGSTDKFIKASVYDSNMVLSQELTLDHVSGGFYSKAITLAIGKFYTFYQVYNDALFTSKSSLYSDAEEVISVTNDSDKLDELHKLQGLDSANPMTVTESQRVAGSITQNFTGDGISTTTITRV